MITPEIVFNFVLQQEEDEDSEVIERNLDFLKEILLKVGDNSSNWYSDENGMTVLHYAVSWGNMRCIEIILDAGHDINRRINKGNTALHFAVCTNRLEVVEKLLVRGIDINSQDNDGYSALQLPIKQNDPKNLVIFETLLKRDDLDVNSKNRFGHTALHNAALLGLRNYVILLLVLRNDINIHIKSSNGEIALHCAVYSNNLEIVEMLLDKGSDINSKNSNGITPLHCACSKGFFNIVDMLLKRDDIDIYIKDINYMEAFDFAALSGHFNIIELFLKKGFDTNTNINNGRTRLHAFAQIGRLNIAELLLERGIDIDDDINEYAPTIEVVDENIEYTDCRPVIFNEVEHRRKRAIFDSFINHYIEYHPYINNIYNRCYPTGNVQVAKPSVSWITAEEIRDKYYFDEIFFYLHMYTASVYIKKRHADASSSQSISISSSSEYFVNNSDKTSTLMTILTDRLRMYLKPNQYLGFEVPYIQRDDDYDYDFDEEDDYIDQEDDYDYDEEDDYFDEDEDNDDDNDDADDDNDED